MITCLENESMYQNPSNFNIHELN